MDRRGFLKISGQAATAVTALALAPGAMKVFDEPIIATPWRDWITDKGDWYEVFVPAYKSLHRETFDKPILLILGQGASFAHNLIEGFVNLATLGSGSLMDACRVDATGYHSTLKDRAALHYMKGEGLTVLGSTFMGADIGVKLENVKYTTLVSNCVRDKRISDTKLIEADGLTLTFKS